MVFLLLHASAHAQQILIAAFVRTLLKWLAVLVKYRVSSFLDNTEQNRKRVKEREWQQMAVHNLF